MNELKATWDKPCVPMEEKDEDEIDYDEGQDADSAGGSSEPTGTCEQRSLLYLCYQIQEKRRTFSSDFRCGVW